MIYLDPKTLACHHCKTVTTDSGQTVWVCENCGEENTVPAPDANLAQAAIDAAAKIPVPEMPAVPPVPSAEKPAV